jgi:PAS domain S-box-containing protein
VLFSILSRIPKRCNEVNYSQDQLRMMIDKIPALAWSCLPDGTTEFLNLRWLDYTGLSMEQALECGWKGPIHPDDLGKLTDTWQRLLASGESVEVEARMRRFDTEYRWFLLRAESMRGEQGEVVRWYGTSTDIHDLKRAKEKLQHVESDLRVVIDTIPTMAWTAQPDGSVDFVSRPWLEYTGFSMEDWLGKGWRTVAHPEDLNRTAEKWQAALATGEPYECEVRTRTARGSYRWCLSRAVPLRDQLGKIVKWFGTNTDIDERKKAVEKLQRSEAFLAQGQSISHTGSFGWNVLSGEIYWSEETYNIFELDRAVKPTLELAIERTHPCDRDCLQEIIARASEPRANLDFENRLLMPDGSIKHLHVVARATRMISRFIDFLRIDRCGAE